MSPQRWSDLPPHGLERRRHWRNYVLANLFEAMLSLAAIASGISTITRPEDVVDGTALERQLGYLAIAWGVLYLLGGVAVLVGLVRVDVRIEVAGLSVLAGVITANALALVTLGPAAIVATLFYLGWAGACAARVWRLVHLGRMIADRARESGVDP